MNNSHWITYSNKGKTLPKFVKEIEIKKELKKAILYISAIGLYSCEISKKKLSSAGFLPGYTDFLKRVQYQKYDVLSFFKQGKNTIEIILAPGWASSEYFAWTKHPYSDKSKLNVELILKYKDGSSEIIYSDESWDIYSSHIIDSEIYAGEEQDFTLEDKFVEKAVKTTYKGKLILQEGEDVIEDEIIFPREMFVAPKKEILIDFGQNFTGNIIFEIEGQKGEVLSFLPAEVLDKDGNFYNENYRDAKSYFKYTLKNGKNILHPLFSFQGLRYIKLIDIPKNFDISCLKGVAIHSKIERTCYFDCGNEKINQLYHNLIRGQLGNYLDIPTDCPQRDERLGWLGDAQVFARTACINFNCNKFFKKWLHDLELDQHDDGSIEGVAPTIKGHPVEISSGRGDAITICPYEVYMAYGDKKVLEDAYPAMVKWVEYIRHSGENEYLWNSGFHFGDWLSQDAPYGSFIGSTNVFLVATAYYAYSTSLLIKAGKVLGKNVDEYEELYENIKKAFRNEFLDESGLPKGERAFEGTAKEQTSFTQCAIVLMLYFDLVEDKYKQRLTDELVKLIEENGMRMTTGFLGTPYILHALSDNGRSDIAYKLLLQEKKPSWLYSVNMGATTIWEHWDNVDENGKFWNPIMNSFNHYAYGSIFDWLFNCAAGIKPIKPSYKEVIINPSPYKDLGHLDIKYKTKNGLLHVRWYFQGDATIYEIEIPDGVKAHIVIKDKDYNLEKGKYMFSHKN